MLKKIGKWLVLGLGGLLGLAVLAVLALFVVTEAKFAETFEVPADTVSVPTGEQAVTEGARLAALRGCNGGCHGPGGAGQVFFELPDGTRVVAPNLAAVAAGYSDEDLARAIRHGVRPDGTSLFAVMPSEMFYGLSDEDLGRIIAWIRSRPADGSELPESRFGPMLRGMILRFEGDGFEPLAARAIDHQAERAGPGNDPVSRGEYLAMTVCTECHGADLEGSSVGLKAPSLAMVKAYDAGAFDRLMLDGIGLGDRELGVMTEVARGRFSHFTTAERADLYTFLKGR